MFIPQVLLIFVAILWLWLLWKRRKYYILALKVRGPWGYPLIGMIHKLWRREDILKSFAECRVLYGSFFYSWLGPIPFLVTDEPQIAQDVLTSPHCVNKAMLYTAVEEGTGRGLFSLKDPEWSRHRKLLNSAFKHRVLVSFMPIFNDEANKLLKTFAQKCDVEEVNVLNILQEYTLAIATQTTMGSDLRTEANSGEVNIMECYQCLLENMTELIFSPWRNWSPGRWCFGNLKSFEEAKRSTRKFIRSLIFKQLDGYPTQLEDSASPRGGNIFINLAIELLKKGDFTYENVEDEANVIVFGAFETTANTISYILMLLAMFPIYQQKLFEEIKNLFPDQGDFDVSVQDTQKFVYMDMIINESMRLLAPVPIIAREVSKDFRLSNGLPVPAGVQIAINIFSLHRRQDIWGPDAHKFNPEHFLPSNLDEKHPYAFIPFTKGIRNCIGWRYALLSVKVVLTKLVRNFHFKTNFNFEDLAFVEDITLKLQKIPLLMIHKRKS